MSKNKIKNPLIEKIVVVHKEKYQKPLTEPEELILMILLVEGFTTQHLIFHSKLGRTKVENAIGELESRKLIKSFNTTINRKIWLHIHTSQGKEKAIELKFKYTMYD